MSSKLIIALTKELIELYKQLIKCTKEESVQRIYDTRLKALEDVLK